ncbi:MAG: CBS domain-containing protein [Pseudomonadota bacterium]|nr:CBS domain-containing protein [Pseudomonadota bacterium]
MINNNINRLPVIEGGSLLGIVTRGDILKALAGCSCCTR